MARDKPPRSGELIVHEASGFSWDSDDERRGEDVVIRPPASYRQALGDEPIRVGAVEFQIMLFLASRPYHAFTRREIAAAVSERLPVTEELIDSYVSSLRDQLGVFHDFVQTVPHVGYRFKA